MPALYGSHGRIWGVSERRVNYWMDRALQTQVRVQGLVSVLLIYGVACAR